MKRFLFIAGLVVLLLAGGSLWIQQANTSREEVEFQVTPVIRGDLENVVSSTGSLEAVGTVNVGSQISGTLENVLVDYNDKVKKGQILAVVDTTLLTATVRDAEATVMQRRAQLHQAKAEHQRKYSLFKQGYISEMEFLAVETSVETAQANLVSAEASLQRAKTNLKYAEIRSPIDGTVIERSVDTGQTIAASMSAPTLFTIAEDLARMQIEAAVDESDIGQIKEGQTVRFTVQAYPDEMFTGTVRQIRLKPTVDQDVVNYTVVVDASNERGLLLPGMTATVDFLVEERKNVLLVPNTALYFKPPEEILAGIREKTSKNTAPKQPGQSSDSQQPERQQSDAQPPDRQRPQRQRPTGQRPDRQQPGANLPAKMATVFYLDEDGAPAMARFLPGATNGIMTEVRRSRDLKEGMQVITGVNKQDTSEKSRFPLPFLGGGRGRRPPF